MSGPYLIAALILLCASSIAFFIYWRINAREAASLRLQMELYQVINNASLGGYYYWNYKLDIEEFSPNLIKVLNLHKKVKNFQHFTKIFGDDAKSLLDLVEKTKKGELENFMLHCLYTTSDSIRNIQCFANRIDDSDGVHGIVIWFYDVSEYVQKINKVVGQNNRIKSEAKDYLTIFNSLPIPVWWRDRDLSIKHCNLAYSQIVNDEKADVIETKIPDLDLNSRAMLKAAMKEKTDLHTKKYLVVNGERLCFDISEHVVSEGVIGYANDITHKENAEKELNWNISAHTDLLENLSNAVAHYGSDKRLRFYNNAFVKLWGFDEQFLYSSPTYSEIIEMLRKQRKLPEQADFKMFRDKQMKLFKEIMSVHNEFYYLPDGRTLRVIIMPHALGGLLFSYEDMTDRIAIERSYNTLMAVQKETLDNLREGVAVFGRDGALKLYNPMYAKMWPDEVPILDKKPLLSDLVEKSKHLFNYGANWDDYKLGMMEQPTTKEPIMKRMERTDGMVIDLLVLSLPDGDYMLSYEDVTDTILAEITLRERNLALEEADKLKTEFLANVSYELRTPLTSILGFSEMLETGHFGALNKQQEGYIKDISDASRQLMSLINDILDLASIEAGYMVLDIKEFDVFALLVSIKNSMRERCDEAGLELVMDCPPDIGTIFADEKRVKQIMYNLMGNSIKFTDEGGMITIGANENKKGEVSIWVQDTGIGISRNDKIKVFDRFFKSSVTKGKKKSGTGLGLTIVKNIVDLHEGKVILESKENEGTKVKCYFKRKNRKLLKEWEGLLEGWA
jgi:signal transduction histidine kinase/PAS domain-containing protein